MIEKTQVDNANASARRRLLRGAFGAPAMLTLCSGSALAASSSKCLANATASPSTAAVITITATPQDTYLRTRLLLGADNKYYLVGNSLSGFARSGYGNTDIPKTGEWRQFKPGTNTVTGAIVTTNPGGSLSNKWAALRFNSAGELVGVGTAGTGSVVGGSCWTSLKA